MKNFILKIINGIVFPQTWVVNMASEKSFENRVKKFLKEQGCYFIKYWGGGEFTKAGVPDILVCCNGKFLGVEVKAQNGRPSPLKEQGCYFIKYWGGGEFTKAGVPDILVCCNGKFLGVEVKAQNGRPSPLQIHNLKKIDDSGGYGILLYPNHFEVFKNLILCIKEEDVNSMFNYNIFKHTLNQWEWRLKVNG